MQEDPGAEPGAGAVPQISHHWTAEALEMNPELVAAAGERFQGDEAAIVGMSQQPVTGMGSLRTGHLLRMRGDPISARVLAQPGLHLPLREPRASVYDGCVLLLYPTSAEGLRQTPGGLAGAGEDQDAGDRTIQPMHRRNEDPTGLTVSGNNVGPCMVKDARIPCGVSLDQGSCGLVHDQEVVVFVQDLEGRQAGTSMWSTSVDDAPGEALVDPGGDLVVDRL